MMGGTIFKTASEKDIEYGRAQVMAALVETCRELGLSFSDTTSIIMAKFNKSEAEELTRKYW